MPVMSPRAGGTPDAMAMPIHRGSATKKTTNDATTSSRHAEVPHRVVAADSLRGIAVYLQRNKRILFGVKLQHLSGFKLVDPAMKPKLLAAQPGSH